MPQPPPIPEESGFLARERSRLLPSLVPPLVHRLNNALAVIQGLGEIGMEPSRNEMLARELAAARALLAGLSSFAREQAPSVETFDLREALRGVISLSRPLAEAAGVALEAREPARGVIVRGDSGQLEQLLTTLLLQEILAVGGGSGGRGLVRLSLRRGGGRAVVTVVRPRGDRGTTPPAIMASAARFAERNGASLFMRSLGSVACYRLVFPVLEEAEDSDADFAGGSRHLLLVEGDGQLSELIKTICTEAGYSVHEPDGGAFDPVTADIEHVDLVLFDTDLEEHRPGILGALEARFDGSGRLLLLGDPPRGARSSTPCLRKPFRPHELLTAVSRTVA